MTKSIEYPFTRAQVSGLKVGDRVRMSGLIYTGRDRLHRFLAEEGKSPVDLRNGAMFHCGPIVMAQGGRWTVRAAGPTTSLRQERYMADIIARHRVRVVIGKGGMGEQTRLACRKQGCIYVQVVGGAAALIASHITDVRDVYFLREFGPTEALWVLTVSGMEGVVTMDAAGRSLHKRIEAGSRRAARGLQKDPS